MWFRIFEIFRPCFPSRSRSLEREINDDDDGDERESFMRDDVIVRIFEACSCLLDWLSRFWSDVSRSLSRARARSMFTCMHRVAICSHFLLLALALMNDNR